MAGRGVGETCLVSVFDAQVARRFLPASALSALDLGYSVVLQVGPDVEVPAHVAEHPQVEVRRAALHSFGTTNFTVPRFVVLPEVLRERGTVIMQDVDCILVQRIREGGRTALARWGGSPNGHLDLENDQFRRDEKHEGWPAGWASDGRRILACIGRFAGETGLRIADAAAAELAGMGDVARDRWFADQVGLWRGLLRVGSNRVDWLDEVRYRMAATSGPIRHPHPADKPSATKGRWDIAAAPYQERWRGLRD